MARKQPPPASVRTEDRQARYRTVRKGLLWATLFSAALVGLLFGWQETQNYLLRDAQFRMPMPPDLGEESPNLEIHGIKNAARAQVADPAGSGAIVGALNWLQGTLLGTVATVAAVIAVAAVGFMMLTGRMNWRYGATVILGCFILFGAGAIVAGLRQSAGGV